MIEPSFDKDQTAKNAKIAQRNAAPATLLALTVLRGAITLGAILRHILILASQAGRFTGSTTQSSVMRHRTNDESYAPLKKEHAL
jgi:hypothetical protein